MFKKLEEIELNDLDYFRVEAHKIEVLPCRFWHHQGRVKVTWLTGGEAVYRVDFGLVDELLSLVRD